LGVLVFALLAGWAADRWRATATIARLKRDMRETTGYRYLNSPEVRDFAKRQELLFRPGYASIIDGTDHDIAVASRIDLLRELAVAGGSVSPEGWSHLADMESLQGLHLSNVGLDHAAMQAMGSLKVRTLTVRSCRFGDECSMSSNLAMMNRLERLEISDSATFTGEIYHHLQGLTRLERISHASTGFESQHIEHLSGFNDLHTLDLSACKRVGGGEAGRHLKALTSVKVLMLSGTAINDNDVEGIYQLPVLWKLELNGTRVTDAAVPNLGRLRSLRILLVVQTDISTRGVTQLRELLPDCDIHYEY
jgi:hypothetical protein